MKTKIVIAFVFTISVALGVSKIFAQATNEVVHACVAQSTSSERAQNVNGQANNGSVRIVSSPTDCKTSEHYVSWNNGYGMQEQLDALQIQLNDIQNRINILSRFRRF